MQSERQWRRIREYRDSGNLEAARVACLSLLEASPHDVDAWHLLAMLEGQRGRYVAARAAAVEAGKRAAAHGAHPRLAHVTQALLAFDEWMQVRELVCESDWTSADIARQAPVLAQHLSLAGDDAATLRFCDYMRARLRADARLEYVAGLSARNTGDAAAAEAAFERSIEADPGFTAAHWSLAYHRPRGDARIPRLRQAVQTLPLSSEQVVDLNYALYRENEAAGHLAGAWRWLEAAMKMKRGRVESLPAPVLQPVPGVAAPDGADAATDPIIFIVGLPRTGTTVLERVLGNHPRVRALGELNAFHAALCTTADRFLPMPTSTTDVPELVDPARVGALYRDAIAKLGGAGHVAVDKNPANFLYAQRVAQALPEARILCLRREPMDACFSNLKELFPADAYPYSYSLADVAAHYAWFDRMRVAFEAALPGRFMTVPYEAMVSDPRAMAESVFAFCGLDYVEGAERIERNAAPVSTASSTQVREAVHARGIGAWKRYDAELEPLRLRLIELGVSA